MQKTRRYKVGITSRIIDTKGYKETRDAISHDLVSYCISQNSKPIIIPNNLDLTKDYIEGIDLLILSGGNDISSVLNKDQKDYKISKLRDMVENELISLSIEKNIPILGICRGMQLLNLYFGGSIKLIDSSLSHVSNVHKIKFESHFFSNYSIDSLNVNSFHNYGISVLGENLDTVARSTDSLVEAFKHSSLPIYGIMWHPERDMPDKSSYNINLLKNIIENK